MNTSRLHLYFWGAASFIFASSLAVGGEALISTNVDATATSMTRIGIGLGIFMFFSGLGYYVLRGQDMTRSMVHLHVWPTLIGIAWFFYHCLSLASDSLPIVSKTSDVLAAAFGLVGLGLVCYLVNMSIQLLAKFLR